MTVTISTIVIYPIFNNGYNTNSHCIAILFVFTFFSYIQDGYRLTSNILHIFNN